MEESVPFAKEESPGYVLCMFELDPKKVEKKMRAMNDMFMFAYNLKKFQLKQKHPDWTERQLNHKAYDLIERGCR